MSWLFPSLIYQCLGLPKSNEERRSAIVSKLNKIVSKIELVLQYADKQHRAVEILKANPNIDSVHNIDGLAPDELHQLELYITKKTYYQNMSKNLQYVTTSLRFISEMDEKILVPPSQISDEYDKIESFLNELDKTIDSNTSGEIEGVLFAAMCDSNMSDYCVTINE